MIEEIKNGYIININKPVHWTSFKVVRAVRKITGIKKVGHAGTLDPFATGVLLIGVGKATKILNSLMKLPKEYLAQLQLGACTDTLDVTGKIVQQETVPPLTQQQIRDVLKKFEGIIQQRIPDFSAAKVGGKRLYKLARQGKTIPELYKSVEIHRIELVDFGPDWIRFRTLCSRGTYIRTLGADIARELGTVGYLKQLIRTRIGEYTLSSALSITDFEEQWSRRQVYENFSKR
ncbi:MAG: hypothetical protein Kow0042_13850 [Calditrichia bacterium]